MNSIAVRPSRRTSIPLKLRHQLTPLLQKRKLQRFLETLAEYGFAVRRPVMYWRIARARGRRRDEERAIGRMVAAIERNLEAQQIKGEVSGRLKRISSIYRKMQYQDVRPEAIKDLRGVRIIVAGETSCYRVLTMLHRKYEPVLGELDDYIAHPKENGYQSLHTVVRDLSGRTYEVQIRTSLMHRIAVRGSAAHWRYKSSNGRRATSLFH